MDSEFVENEEENVEKEIKYWNNLKYQEVKRDKEANVIKYYEKEETETREFMWITSFKITDKNKEEIVYYGKQRWKIENESTLLFYTICTYDKTITRKRAEIHKRIKNKHKRSKCSYHTNTYSKTTKSN